jgi:hypothetical protein
MKLKKKTPSKGNMLPGTKKKEKTPVKKIKKGY